MLNRNIVEVIKVTDVKMLRRHFHRTLEIWDTNYNTHREEIQADKGESLYSDVGASTLPNP